MTPDVLLGNGYAQHSSGSDLRDPGGARPEPPADRGPAHPEPRRRSLPGRVPGRAHGRVLARRARHGRPVLRLGARARDRALAGRAPPRRAGRRHHPVDAGRGRQARGRVALGRRRAAHRRGRPGDERRPRGGVRSRRARAVGARRTRPARLGAGVARADQRDPGPVQPDPGGAARRRPHPRGAALVPPRQPLPRRCDRGSGGSRVRVAARRRRRGRVHRRHRVRQSVDCADRLVPGRARRAPRGRWRVPASRSATCGCATS